MLRLSGASGYRRSGRRDADTMFIRRFALGTDITMFAERRRETGWESVGTPIMDEYVQTLAPARVADFERPYELYSVLAATSIAYCRLAVVPSISPPRGFPEDMHEIDAQYVARAYQSEPLSGDWGASWLHVAEITGFDWDGQRVEEHAYVDPDDAAMFRDGEGFPAAFPSDKEMFHDLYLDPPEGKVKVTWSTPLREYVGCVDWFTERLLSLGPSDEVRIIYWFNS